MSQKSDLEILINTTYYSQVWESGRQQQLREKRQDKGGGLRGFGGFVHVLHLS